MLMSHLRSTLFRFSILRTFRLLRVFRPFRYNTTLLLCAPSFLTSPLLLSYCSRSTFTFFLHTCTHFFLTAKHLENPIFSLGLWLRVAPVQTCVTRKSDPILARAAYSGSAIWLQAEPWQHYLELIFLTEKMVLIQLPSRRHIGPVQQRIFDSGTDF
ncbi:hypothetical protein F5888DRAFT_174237 [Russula emetica]|nr:hypothetical protein F5888DRAFT_174237 [Russula emetica]